MTAEGRYCIDGKCVTIKEIAAHLGVSRDCAWGRMKRLQKQAGKITWDCLQSQPVKAEPVGVTDAMVERALGAWYLDRFSDTGCMRAALEAARRGGV